MTDLRNITMSDAPRSTIAAKVRAALATVQRRLSPTRPAPDMAAASPWLGKAVGIDISRYQAQILPLPDGCIDFGIAKLGGSEYAAGVGLDPMFASHVQSIYDCKAIPMAYWYVDSNFYPGRNYSWGDLDKFTTEGHPILSKIIEGLRAGSRWKFVKALFFDVEIPGAGDNWTTHYIDDLQSRIVGLQRTGQFPQLKLGIYSRKSVMDTMPALSNWVFNHPEMIIWTANYVRSFPGTLRPLADHRTLSMPSHNPIWYGDHPDKPKELKRVWQYMGSFDGAMNATSPEVLGGNGKPSALDLNVWEYTRTELHAALGVTDRLGVQPDPEPEPDPNPDPDEWRAAVDARLTALEAAPVKAHTHIPGGVA